MISKNPLVLIKFPFPFKLCLNRPFECPIYNEKERERTRANANFFLWSLSLLNVKTLNWILYEAICKRCRFCSNINKPLPLLIDVHFGCGIKRRHIGGNLGSTLEDRRQFTAHRVPQILQLLRVRPRVFWLRGWKQFLNLIFISWTINSRDCTAFWLVAKTLTTTTFIFFDSAIQFCVK